MIPCHSFFFSGCFPLQVFLSLIPVFSAYFLQYMRTLAPAVPLLGKTSTQLVVIGVNVLWWAQEALLAGSSSLLNGTLLLAHEDRLSAVSSLCLPGCTAALTSAVFSQLRNMSLSDFTLLCSFPMCKAGLRSTCLHCSAAT